MTIPSVLTNPEAWDRITVGPILAPGVVSALSIKRVHDVTLSKPGGQDGETIKVNGQKLAQVWITITWWPDDTGENMAAYEQLLDMLFPLVGSPTAVDVVHPKLQAHKLRKLFVTELSDEQLPLSATGVQTLVLQCCNYRPPKKKVPVIGGKPLVPDVSKNVDTSASDSIPFAATVPSFVKPSSSLIDKMTAAPKYASTHVAPTAPALPRP